MRYISSSNYLEKILILPMVESRKHESPDETQQVNISFTQGVFTHVTEYNKNSQKSLISHW